MSSAPWADTSARNCGLEMVTLILQAPLPVMPILARGFREADGPRSKMDKVDGRIREGRYPASISPQYVYHAYFPSNLAVLSERVLTSMEFHRLTRSGICEAAIGFAYRKPWA